MSDEMIVRLESGEMRLRLRENRQRGRDLSVRSEEVIARSRALMRQSWEVRMRAKAARDWAAAARVERPVIGPKRDSPVKWFTVAGMLGDRPVAARWEAGVLDCDPRLRTQAQLFVDMGCVFRNGDPPASVEATLSGPPAAVMLTLAQACDRVTAVDFEPVNGG